MFAEEKEFYDERGENESIVAGGEGDDRIPRGREDNSVATNDFAGSGGERRGAGRRSDQRIDATWGGDAVFGVLERALS